MLILQWKIPHRSCLPEGSLEMVVSCEKLLRRGCLEEGRLYMDIFIFGNDPS